MSSTDLENVGPHSRRADTFALDIEPAKPHQENIFAADYYEILRVDPHADEDTIERVYYTLAGRFHPDNASTGDSETFLRLRAAYETLSDPAERAKYNALRQYTKGSARFWLRGREFFDGVRGVQNRRLAVLCLLYRRRISTHESPGLTILDLERLTGCSRDELGSALWYLREKKWATIGEFTAYSITADGFDVVESKLEDRLEFRALATWCYYGLSAELQDSARLEPRFWKNDILPLDIEPATTMEGGVFIADHYEILGIGAQADEEAIERVYHTLAGRFHPDNPTTGDTKTFLRIREAYDTLSDQCKRAQYNALRQRTRYSERFRLRGREFFDGIKGEQLRRLAVLCLLYRQGASESPGLTVLDLEQLTGCTREELGSALWYLREKKWATSGEFTEYSITAAGFDVVESKLEDREAARSLILNTIAPENRNSRLITGIEQTDIKAEEQSEDVEVSQGPMPIEEAPRIAKQVTRSEDGAEREEREAARAWDWLYPEDTSGDELVYLRRASPAHPAEQSRLNIPVKPGSSTPNTIAPENQNSRRIAESEQTDVKVEEPPDEQPAVAPEPAQIEDAPVPAEQGTRFEDGAEAQEREAVNSRACLAPEDESASPQPSAAQPAAQGQPNVQVTPQSSGVSRMSNSNKAIADQTGGVAVRAEKRVILSMGGKGGVGKTSVMTGLAEWFEENQIPAILLDLDIENKAVGSLTHFFGGRVPKINIHTPAGLDAFVDQLAESAPVILGDMGAGAGKITHDWFDKMYPDVAAVGIVFTAIGVVTSDPASVESVLNWAEALEDRVSYVIVENNLTEHTDFTYWQQSEQAEAFRKRFQPAIIRLDYRLSDLENAVRNYGVTLGRVAGRTAPQAELQKASLVMRAQSYRRRMFAQFDKVKELLLP